MKKEKIFIKNRKGQKIAVILKKAEPQKGLAIIMHGLGGFKEQPHIRKYAEAFKEAGCTVIRFDTTNTFGESDGDYEFATTTNYYEDLEDVIAWAKEQPWYNEPFYLAGHSLGSICTAWFAEKYPEKVKALAPTSTVISGKLSLESYSKAELEEWERTGYRTEYKTAPNESKPGLIKKLRWKPHIKDRLRYDLLKNVDKLTMPVLLIVGDKDKSTPLKHQQMLFEKLPGEKEMHIIKGAPHTFKDQKHLDEIKKIFSDWIKK